MACLSETLSVTLNWEIAALKNVGDMIARAKNGDANALEQLITLYERPVLRTAWRMLGSREEAREATQEVFLRFFKYLDRFREGSQLQPWLYRIATNVCRDINRKRRREQRVFVDQESAQPQLDRLAGGEDQEQAAVAADECAIVLEALETLPPKEREAVVLRDIEGLSTAETARAMGCLQITVRSHLSRARVKVKEYRDRRLKQGGTR